MRGARGALAALAAAGLATQPALAGERVELAPSSAWLVDYAEDSCALQRQFGDEGQRVMLEMRQFSPTDSLLRVMVVSAAFEPRGKDPLVRFEPDAQPHDQLGFVDVDLAEGFRGVQFQVGLYPAQLRQAAREALEQGTPMLPWSEEQQRAREAGITGLLVEQAFERDLALKIGSLAKPLAALRTCLDELLVHWGLDAEVQRTLTRQPTPTNMDSVARDMAQTYPAMMVRARREEVVSLRLMVSPEGRVSECHLQKGISDLSFAENACSVLGTHLRFAPALDATGQPVAGYYTTTLLYKMP